MKSSSLVLINLWIWILAASLLSAEAADNPIKKIAKKVLTPVQEAVVQQIEKQRANLRKLIGIDPEQKFSSIFTNITRFNLSQIRNCYDMSLSDEEWEHDLFDNTVYSSIKAFYQYCPDNFKITDFPVRVKKLYETFFGIAKYTLSCLLKPRSYSIGLTQMSDWTDSEYRALLGATESDDIVERYINRFQQDRIVEVDEKTKKPSTIEKFVDLITNPLRKNKNKDSEEKNNNNHSNQSNSSVRRPNEKNENRLDDERRNNLQTATDRNLNNQESQSDKNHNLNENDQNLVKNKNDFSNSNQNEINGNKIIQNELNLSRETNKDSPSRNQNSINSEPINLNNHNENISPKKQLENQIHNNYGKMNEDSKSYQVNQQVTGSQLNNQEINYPTSAPSRRYKRSTEVAEKCKVHDRSPLPKNLDWRSKGMVTPVKYQGSCGSCWTFASLASLESSYLIKGKTNDKRIDLSEQEILECAKKNGCKGGTGADAYNYMLKSNGVTDEKTSPYKSGDNKCQATKNNKKVATIKDYCLRGKYAKVNNRPENLTDQEIMLIIREFGPVYTTINADDLMMRNLKNGIYEFEDCPKKTNHAVTIVGWDEKSWIIKNSWGKSWGLQGFFRMKKGENLCGINTYVMYTIV